LATPLSGGRVLILPGDATGNFRSRSQIDVPLGILVDYEVADLNGDQQPEFLILNQRENTIDVWEHAVATGTSRRLSSAPAGAQVQRFVLTDFNADQRLDAVVVTTVPPFGGQGQNQLRLLRGNGDGSFTDAGSVALSTAPTDVLAGEINGDSLPDLVVVHGFAGTLSSWVNSGNGTFQPDPPIAAGEYASPVLLPDLDQDGRAELIVAGTQNQGQQSFCNVLARGANGAWTLRQPLDPTTQIQALTWTDVNGDGTREVLAATADPFSGAGRVDRYPVTQGTLGSAQTLLSWESGIYDLAVGDANGDQRPDLYLPGGVFLAEPNGGFSGLQPFWIGDAGLLKVLDLNADGRLDVVGLAYSSVMILLHE
jgi:hypothetical protein